MTPERIIKWGYENPKKVFLFDGIGATLSAILLGIILVKMERFFGIPKSALYFLASLPCLFAIYDIFCYLKIDENIGTFLNVIAIANLLYCALSIGLALYHFCTITPLGWAYLIIETIIVSTIASFELNVAKRLLKK